MTNKRSSVLLLPFILIHPCRHVQQSWILKRQVECLNSWTSWMKRIFPYKTVSSFVFLRPNRIGVLLSNIFLYRILPWMSKYLILHLFDQSILWCLNFNIFGCTLCLFVSSESLPVKIDFCLTVEMSLWDDVDWLLVASRPAYLEN